MSTQNLPAVPPIKPEPPQDSAPAAPSQVDTLLCLVRRLIGFGAARSDALKQDLACNLPQPDCFGGIAVTTILLRTIRGLKRAAALERTLLRHGERGLETNPASRQRTAGAPRARLTVRPPLLPQDGSRTVRRLATTKELVAELRRKPIGALLAEICSDLGITRDALDPAAWEQLHRAIADHGGGLARYYRGMLQQEAPQPPAEVKAHAVKFPPIAPAAAPATGSFNLPMRHSGAP